jgi:hypothetical protein
MDPTNEERRGSNISEVSFGKEEMKIIIIHLLGLAPAGYLAAPDNGP